MPQTVIPVTAYDVETDEYGPGVRASSVGRICKIAKEKDLNAFGAFRTVTTETAVANSNGLFVYHPATAADFQVTVSGHSGSGRAQESAWNVANINTVSVGMEAIDKAIRAQDPQPIEPGKYTVVLDPYAVQDLVLMLNITGMGAQSVQEGYSWMSGRLEEQLMSPMVSIWDDGIDPAGLPMPFDFEGVPKQRVQIVEEGWLRGPVYDTYTANKEGKRSTGHATPPNMMFHSGPLAQNLFMAPGQSSVEEMIKETESGLYITRFWYTRPVHPRDCVVTGMTRDGVFLIEGGQLTKPVKNLRFTQSYLEALANVSAVSRERKTLIGEYGGSVCVPAVKIDSFNFTGLTV
jgi:predicted Zn-dependent protease